MFSQIGRQVSKGVSPAHPQVLERYSESGRLAGELELLWALFYPNPDDGFASSRVPCVSCQSYFAQPSLLSIFCRKTVCEVLLHTRLARPSSLIVDSTSKATVTRESTGGTLKSALSFQASTQTRTCASQQARMSASQSHANGCVANQTSLLSRLNPMMPRKNSPSGLRSKRLRSLAAHGVLLSHRGPVLWYRRCSP